MQISMEQFQKKYIELYLSDTSKYTPLALWKMQALTAEGEAFYLPEYECYYVIRAKQLLVYISADGVCHIPVDELNKLACISMNADLFDIVKDQLIGFDIFYYWSLNYDFSYIVKETMPEKYEAVDFNLNDEGHYQTAADIIKGDDGDFTPQRIKRMMAFPTFDPSLWLFVRDINSQKLIGVGISNYHKLVKETDLDWIFILPEYWGKGAGRFLIEEIVRRTAARSKVIRVGGTNEFYKRCGFYEKEYWALAVKPEFSLDAPCIQP